jgi:hypothetical protein
VTTREVSSSGSSLLALSVQANVSPTYADPNEGGRVSCGSVSLCLVKGVESLR